MDTLQNATAAVNPDDRSSRGSSTHRRAQGDVDETVIVIDHGSKTAAIWTTRRSIVNRLRRLGATQEDRVGPGIWLRISAAAIRFKKPRTKSVSEATRAHLAAMAASARA